MQLLRRLNRARLKQICYKLFSRIEALKKENVNLNNQVAYLTASVNRWTKKFRDPRYHVPEKVINEMEEEFAKFREKVRAEVVRLRVEKAILIDKVVKLEGDQENWHGDQEREEEMQIELVESHGEAKISDKDRAAIENAIVLKRTKQKNKRKSGNGAINVRN